MAVITLGTVWGVQALRRGLSSAMFTFLPSSSHPDTSVRQALLVYRFTDEAAETRRGSILSPKQCSQYVKKRGF